MRIHIIILFVLISGCCDSSGDPSDWRYGKDDLRGSVIDNTGKPLSGVLSKSILLMNEVSSDSVLTGSDGSYSITNGFYFNTEFTKCGGENKHFDSFALIFIHSTNDSMIAGFFENQTQLNDYNSSRNARFANKCDTVFIGLSNLSGEEGEYRIVPTIKFK